MAETRDFGQVIFIGAEAIGQPGQRRFRLRALSAGGGSAVVWVEKEQLTAVGEAIESVLEGESFHYERPPLDDRGPEPVFPLNADIEFRAGQMQMGLDRDQRLVVLIASEATGSEEPDAEALSVSFEYPLAAGLRAQIAEVVAAGRKPCPLCTAPMDPTGHVCVKSNGHHPH